MAANSKKIILGKQELLVIDLTDPLHPDQQGYPGDPGMKRILVSDIGQDGWHYYTHEIGDHSFHPHCDAPNHFLPDRQESGMEIYGLSWAFHRACMIDLSGSPEAEEHDGIPFLTRISKDHLTPFADCLKETEALLIRTGYDRWLEQDRPHHPETLPYIDPDAARIIASYNNIRVLGIDSLTVDAFGEQVAHLALKDKMIVESLVHLYGIPESQRAGFTLQTSPVRIVGATGGPVIAYAYITA